MYLLSVASEKLTGWINTVRLSFGKLKQWKCFYLAFEEFLVLSTSGLAESLF